MKTARKKLTAKLTDLYEWCKANRHLPLREQQEMLRVKMLGHYQYYGVSFNYASLARYAWSVRRIWCKWLGRRLQRSRIKWERFGPSPQALSIAQGQRVHRVAFQMQCSPRTVRRSCLLYEEKGLLGLLASFQRPGRPARPGSAGRERNRRTTSTTSASAPRADDRSSCSGLIWTGVRSTPGRTHDLQGFPTLRQHSHRVRIRLARLPAVPHRLGCIGPGPELEVQ